MRNTKVNLTDKSSDQGGNFQVQGLSKSAYNFILNLKKLLTTNFRIPFRYRKVIKKTYLYSQ